MFKTWGELVAMLREAEGFKGTANLANVKKFLADNGIEVSFASKQTIDTIWADYDKAKKAREVEPEPEPEPETTTADQRLAQRRAAAQGEKVRGAIAGQAERDEKADGGWTPKAHRRQIERKQYERKIKDGKASFSSVEAAEACGAWFRRNMPAYDCSTPDDREVLKSLNLEDRVFGGMGQKAGSSTTNTLGGALIPQEFMPDLISLQEKYGVARSNTRVVPMNRDVLQIPQRTGHSTVYMPGQNTTITDSDITYRDVQLTAQEWAAMSKQPVSLLEDSAINIADTIANDFAYAFALQEDQCFFNGDGTSTYFGIQGVRSAITSLTATQANIAGLEIGTSAWSTMTIATFENVLGKVPQYAWQAPGGIAWYCSMPFYWQTMRRLELAQGGVTAMETRDTGLMLRFMGVPVVITQVLPNVTAATTVHAIVGNLGLGSKFGDRKQIEIRSSDQVGFAANQVWIRAIQRVAMTVHDVGNFSATASSRVPGPICAVATV